MVATLNLGLVSKKKDRPSHDQFLCATRVTRKLGWGHGKQWHGLVVQGHQLAACAVECNDVVVIVRAGAVLQPESFSLLPSKNVWKKTAEIRQNLLLHL